MKIELKLGNKARDAEPRVTYSHEQSPELDARLGWRLYGDCGDDDHFPFIYTVGNCEWALPELLAIDCFDVRVLNLLCEMMRRRRAPFWDGELIKLGDYEHPVKALNTGANAVKYTWQVTAYCEHDAYTVQQILIPDSLGRFPGDPQCEAPRCFVPILQGKRRLLPPAGDMRDFGRIKKYAAQSRR
jgi:hypothetical protein